MLKPRKSLLITLYIYCLHPYQISLSPKAAATKPKSW